MVTSLSSVHTCSLLKVQLSRNFVLIIPLGFLFLCRCPSSVSNSVQVRSASSSSSSIKYLLMEMCVSPNIFKVFATYANDLSRKDCIKIKTDMDNILYSWKLEVKRQISIEMEDMSENIEVMLRCKMRNLLSFIKEILCADIDKTTDEDKWIVNSLMTCDAEQCLQIFHKIIRKSEEREVQLTNIKRFFTKSAKATYQTLEKHKSFQRYLMSKEDNLSERIGKVIFYLRNVYMCKKTKRHDSVPDFILNLMCGHDPLDEDLYAQFCPKIHMKSAYCQKSSIRSKCTFKHYNFNELTYKGMKPNYSVIYEYLVTKL